MTEHALDAATREFFNRRRVDMDRAPPALIRATREDLRAALSAARLAELEEGTRRIGA